MVLLHGEDAGAIRERGSALTKAVAGSANSRREPQSSIIAAVEAVVADVDKGAATAPTRSVAR